MKQRTIRYRPSMLDIYADCWYWELDREQTSQHFSRLSVYHQRQADYHAARVVFYRRRAARSFRVSLISGGLVAAWWTFRLVWWLTH